MIIGIPKEIKNQEFRVGLLPSQALTLVKQGHHVLVESGAGLGIGIQDQDYEKAGASIHNVTEIFAQSEMLVKVKEPQAIEIERLRTGQILFTYLHLAPDELQTVGLLKSGVTAVAYETVKNTQGGLPLLAPMSEVAGRMSIQAAAHHLEKRQGGAGVLMSGIPGVSAAHVLILGAGIVGTNALQMALGLGARVTIVDKNIQRLRELDQIYGNSIQTLFVDEMTLANQIADADAVIGAVLIPGGSAPKLLKKEHLNTMRPGSVIVDVAIDQGGCFETSRATTHEQPTYIEEEVIHYCVANMPGGVPRTSTYGLVNATFPYVQAIANQGFIGAIRADRGLRAGVSTHQGQLTCSAVAISQKRASISIDTFL